MNRRSSKKFESITAAEATDEEQQENSDELFPIVGMGADGDGARGLREIKAVGGITFAQCQESAQVDSMPNTAVATGDVDFILPPIAIAQELVKISHHSYVKRQTSIKLVEEQPEGDQAAAPNLCDRLE